MALTMAFDDAKVNQKTNEEDPGRGLIGRSLVTRFFLSRDDPGFPHATLSLWDPGRVSGAHFHVSDQFQVVITGHGKLGRHDLTPYTVHFTRACTPYGPLSASSDTPLRFFVMRTHFDPGTFRLPAEKERLKEMRNHEPWQITRTVTFPAPPRGAEAGDIMLQPIPGIKDEQGLAAYTLSLAPNADAEAPDPALGDGQYLVVVKGSLWHDQKEQQAPALVFVKPDEGSYQIRAGSSGLEALVLNFPRAEKRKAGAATAARTNAGLKTWQCALCAFVYDEAAGLPDEGIAPGTRWQDVPASWTCPDCGACKADFEMMAV